MDSIYRTNRNFRGFLALMKAGKLLEIVTTQHPEGSFWGSSSSKLLPTQDGQKLGLKVHYGPVEGAWPGEPEELKALSGPPVRRFLENQDRISRQKKIAAIAAADRRKVERKILNLLQHGRIHLGAE